MTASRPPLFDARAAAAARTRARRLAGDRFLDQAATEGLADRLSAVTRRFTHGLWLGDAVPDVLRDFAENWTVAVFDAGETLAAGESSFDLAASLYSLQAINDLPGALVQIRRALKPDGLFLAALFGGGTLRELRESFAIAESEIWGGISPRVAPFADVRDLGGLLQRAGFALPVADVERLTVRYSQLPALAQDLRAHGLGNVMQARRKSFTSRRLWNALAAIYAAQHSEDGKLKASFETVYLTGWAPDQSQQQPLKPGSAKARLSDALGTTERKL